MGSNVVISGQGRGLTVTSATLASCATLACSRCKRSQPRGGSLQQAHAHSRFHHRRVPTKFLARVSRPAGRSVLEEMTQFWSRKTGAIGCKPFVSFSLDQVSTTSVHASSLSVRIFNFVHSSRPARPRFSGRIFNFVFPSQSS